MQMNMSLFEDYEIRRIYDEEAEIGWFSVIDIVQVLTQQVDYQAARKYWNKLKQRLTDVATAQTLLRLVQSVPSPKAEEIKLWLAKVGYERMQELADPVMSLNRARETWQQHGRSEKWIQQRMEYAVLTNIIHQEWVDIDIKAHKKHKGAGV